MQLKVKVDDKEVKELLGDLIDNLEDPKPALRAIGEVIRTSVERNFASQGRPDPWEPSRRVKESGGETLTDTARLRRSFTVEVGDESVAVGTNVIYAAIHHFGGMIRPVHAKALFWGGASNPVKSVKLPARPFLMVQKEDWSEIRETLGDFLTRRS